MSVCRKFFRWNPKPREKRILVYCAILLAVVAWKFLPRPWKPSLVLETAHHTIYSSATRLQTQEIGRVLETLYASYSNRFGSLPAFQPGHPKLQVKLFKGRKEFHRINPGLGWAEAFYREPYCRAYYSAQEINPDHWMLHEAVHQLNHLDTYPVWWIDELATSADLQENLRNQSVIPLRAIITNRGGPSLNRHFNLYYLHWWTLTHFIFENPKYRDRATALVKAGGALPEFERLIGPADKVQSEWHTYVRELKKTLSR